MMSRQRSKKASYHGMLVRQRAADALPFFVFTATAESILRWAQVEPTAKKKGASQRLLSPGHKRSIENYIEASDRNIIPTTITVALPPGTFTVEEYEVEGFLVPEGVSMATVKVDLTGVPGRVIDGQHRLKALEKYPMPLVCSLILGASEVEQALHFIVINNKAKKVNQDLVKSIVHDMSRQRRKEFMQRVAAIRLTLGNMSAALQMCDSKPTSPFRGMIDWDANRQGRRVIKPLALEGALKEISKNLQTPTEIDMDEVVELLIAMWSGVRGAVEDVYEREWGDEELKILTKASFVAITEFMVERLNNEGEKGVCVTDPDFVQEFAMEIMSEIPVEFWAWKWTKKELDTSAGRDFIRTAMKQIRTASNARVDDPFEKVRWFIEPVFDAPNINE